MHAPANEKELCELVLEAVSVKRKLAFRGGGTRQGLVSNPPDAEIVSLARLSGITLYEPAEMVISARAGTPLSEVEAVLAEKGQFLPFEPMDHRALHGSTGEPSIGAVAALNLSGPRRIAVGAARDALIGARFINGKGETIRAGGRVMKNVTGLDLVKLQAGAAGALGPLTEVTLKVLPKKAASLTLELTGLSDADGVSTLCKALGTPFDVSGAAHVPAGGDGPARTLIRLENMPDSVAYRAKELGQRLAGRAGITRIDGKTSDALWRDIRDVVPLNVTGDDVVWRISVKPTDGPVFVDALRATGDFRVLYDWSGGLLWLATSDALHGGLSDIRHALKRFPGHARLERGPVKLRQSISGSASADALTAGLEAGIRKAIDPMGVFVATPLPRFSSSFALAA
jgi:glycolate oxidase FAD binding subunit